MKDIEHRTCECVYYQHGYTLCTVCANILGEHKRAVCVRRWRHKYKHGDGYQQLDDSNDFHRTVFKQDN